MGTTATTLAADPGMRAVWVLAIEGFEYLLTDGDPAAALTAWAEATEWTAALGGLYVTSGFSQKLDPWEPFVAGDDLTFVVRDTGGDVFGTAVMQRGGGEETYLDATLTSNGSTATVKSAAQFASSGAIYIGAERATYTSKTATTFTGLTRGRCAPFAADSETVPRWGRYHRAGVTARSTGVNAIVSSLPRTWHGKWVGLWMHRVVGGVLDTRSQAQLVWAGTIAQVVDAANGDTQIACQHVTAKIRETMLMRDPWTAEAQEGVFIGSGGPSFEFLLFIDQTMEADPLVPTVGASGPYQIEAGYHTTDSLLAALNAWMAAAASDGDIDNAIQFRLEDVEGVKRVAITFVVVPDFDDFDDFLRFKGPVAAIRALGFSDSLAPVEGASARLIHPISEGTCHADGETLSTNLWSQFEVEGDQVDVINVSGTFVDQKDSLPSSLPSDLRRLAFGSANAWGFIWVDGLLFLAEVTAASGTTATLESVHAVSTYMPLDNAQIQEAGRRATSEAGPLEIRQVVILEDSFAALVPKLLASTGTSGYNGDYDDLGHGLGCEIPWELLGQTFVDSCILLDQSASPLRVIIDKPMTFAAALGADFMLRKASLIWRSGGLRVTAWASLTASRAVHHLTEDNKGVPADQRDSQRTPLIASDQWLRNVLKIEYDRIMFEDTYSKVFQWEDRASMDDLGEERPLTIRARNSYQAAGDVIEELAAGLFSSMPFFARPILMLRRPIDMSLYEGVAPGDIVIVDDNFARDPSTGQRGLVGKPGIIMAHRWDRGGANPSDPRQPRPMFGEVDIAIDAIDRTFAWAPAALLDELANGSGFTAGYNISTNTIRCKANEYTLSADGVVDVSYFEVGDSVDVIEIDPASGTSQAWSRGINSKSGNDLTLSAALTGFDTAKRYRVTPQDYVSVVAGQQDVAYQAAGDDARVSNTVAPYLWGEEYGLELNQPSDDLASLLAALPERYSSSSYGDGRPLDVGFETGLVRMATNLTNYKTASQVPCLDTAARNHASVSSWKLHAVIPYFVGPTMFPPGYTRKLYVAPLYRSSGGGSVSVRVTLCRNPPTGDSLEDVPIAGINTAVSNTFTTTSTTFVKPDAVGLRVEPATNGECFIMIEVNSSQAQVYGLAELRLGTLETA